jgi:mersacidin/lichenicidin family type 2 lantibiotic
MSKLDIVRAWKDEEYLNKLSESERSLLPANPVGIIELSDQDLVQAEGGTTISLTFGCFSYITYCSLTFCTVTILADAQLESP